MTHVITMPGDWNHVGLLLRLMEVVEAPFQFTEAGLMEIETGVTVGFAFAPSPHPELAEQARLYDDPTRPPLTEKLLAALDAHQMVAQIQVPADARDPKTSLDLALRAANAVVDGGALAVFLQGSGRIHEADAFQSMMRGLEVDRHQAFLDIAVRFHLGPASTSVGMAELGLPDLLLPEAVGEDRALGLMERAAHQLLQGETLPVVPDTRGGQGLNPHGLVVLG